MQYNRIVGCVEIHIDTKRIDENLKKAQDLLDGRVLADMRNYIPNQVGDLREKTNIVSPGLIETNTPYAHYQYVGLVRTDEEGRVFVEEGKKKPILTDRPLHYHAPGTSDHWFERAKETHKKEWIDLVKREVGKG